jgi:MFS family permease
MAADARDGAADGRSWSVAALLTAAFCSSSAALALTTVIGKQVYDLTGREIDLGLLGLAEFAPAALLVLVTGTVADRFDRRLVAALGAAGEAVVAAALAWYAGTNPTSAAPIFLLVIAFGVCRAFVAPAQRSLPADLVPAERLPWLMPRYSVTWQGALVVGPVMGGLLYAADIRLPFAAGAGLFAVAAVAVTTIRLPARDAALHAIDLVPASTAEVLSDAALEAAVEPSAGHAIAAPPARAGLRDAMEGLRFIRRRPILLGAISLDLFAVLFGGAVALLPAIAKDRLGVGAVGLGWLRAAGGLGAGAVTLVLVARPIRHRVGRVLLSVVAAFGVATIVLGVTRSYVVAFLAMAALSGADAVSVFIRSTLVPLVTPADKRGRVLAVENVFIGASNELGAFESGVAGQLMGTTGAVVLGGAATLVVAGAWWRLFPALRDVDGFPEGDWDTADTG